jgi:hypothetical protein
VRKAKSVANYYEKQRTFGTIGVYIRYCLLNGPKVTLYVQSLTSGIPKVAYVRYGP